MHKAALDWVESSLEWWGRDGSFSVLEFGSLDINGSVRSILGPRSTRYVGIDPAYGKGVDIVADAAVFRDIEQFDVVVCCEVFEHTPKWPQIVSNAHRNLNDGGLFIATMAGDGRTPHSAIDENPLRDWEYYGNVSEYELERVMNIFKKNDINKLDFDLRCCGIK